ncbi:hypothetical protein GCM10009105_37460 [Dokdonella soli]|uniref:Carrier domain-containing protein n=1 Tax=Dokdonella soli TaxID=529810 RepID=A0ABN1J054_9GAMM
MISEGFLLCEVVETLTARHFVEAIERELAASRFNAPMSGAETNHLLITPEAQLVRFCRIGFAVGAAEPSASLPMVLHVNGTTEHVELRLAFDASIYPLFLAEQIAAHTCRLIGLLADSPDATLSQLDALSAHERRQVLETFNAACTPDFPHDLTLHGLVEDTARRRPEAIAVIYEDRTLSYAQLNDQGSRIAAHLRCERGVRPGDRVGIAVNRSEKMLAGILGILKCGAAYVPINPHHPWQTIRYMTDNAEMSVVVVDSDTIASMSAYGGDMFVLDVELASLELAENYSDCEGASNNDAYIIYTSGSTGKPKGVVVQHRAIVNTILWRNAYYGYDASDVTLQMPSIAFDSSVIDIFCALAVGGTLVIPRDELRLDAAHLRDLIKRHSVTTFIATPSYYKLLCSELGGVSTSLRAITLAGEIVTSDLLTMHALILPDTLLYNEYGPTENAVCSTASLLDPTSASVTIGSPITNVQVYIVDDENRLCAPGMPGEIYLGGAGLARGYFNRPDLTALAFTEHPIAELRPRVVYRSGDRGFWRPDGQLQFLGRTDGQVKIRGMRVEMSEVEEALLSHPVISNAVVVCKENDANNLYLAAYVIFDEPCDVSKLRQHLAALLPIYALPEVIERLDELPLTANGKIDRVKLRQRVDSDPSVREEVGPISTLEAQLLFIASDILKRNAIGLDDDLFEMGAHSLRIMEIFSRIRAELTCEASLMDIYARRTIRALARHLSNQSEPNFGY